MILERISRRSISRQLHNAYQARVCQHSTTGEASEFCWALYSKQTTYLRVTFMGSQQTSRLQANVLRVSLLSNSNHLRQQKTTSLERISRSSIKLY
jgi:hypothetical protein